MEEIKEMLEEEIRAEIRSLADLEPGSKEKSTAIDDLTQLYRLKIEDDKICGEVDRRESDEQFHKAQLSDQALDRYLKLGVAAAEILLPLIFYGVWMNRGFRFEENGSFTSTTFKGLISRFRPTK